MLFHATRLVETKGEKKGSLEIRKHLVQYLKKFPNVKQYRKALVTVETLSDTQKVISQLRDDFAPYLKARPSLEEIIIGD